MLCVMANVVESQEGLKQRLYARNGTTEPTWRGVESQEGLKLYDVYKQVSTALRVESHEGLKRTHCQEVRRRPELSGGCRISRRVETSRRLCPEAPPRRSPPVESQEGLKRVCSLLYAPMRRQARCRISRRVETCINQHLNGKVVVAVNLPGRISRRVKTPCSVWLECPARRSLRIESQEGLKPPRLP